MKRPVILSLSLSPSLYVCLLLLISLRSYIRALPNTELDTILIVRSTLLCSWFHFAFDMLSVFSFRLDLFISIHFQNCRMIAWFVS